MEDTSIDEFKVDNPLISIKCSNEDFDVEYDVLPFVGLLETKDERKRHILQGIVSVDEELSAIDDKIQKINNDIDRLTNHADGIDYAVAVTSGIITGIIDATVVGEWDFQKAKKGGDLVRIPSPVFKRKYGY